MRLANKTAFITGGNSGIGLATARLFVAEGAKVAITGRNQATLEAAAKELGPNALALVADATDIAATEQAIQRTVEKFGKLDIVFANAGIPGNTPIGTTTLQAFEAVIRTNITSVFFTVQSAAPHLNDGASIILNGSVISVLGNPGYSAYAASKAGVRAMARVMASELSPRGIRVNVVAPGAARTPIWNGAAPTAEAYRGAGQANFPQHSARPARRSRGSRQDGAVPGLGRCVERSRRGDLCRRRLDRFPGRRADLSRIIGTQRSSITARRRGSTAAGGRLNSRYAAWRLVAACNAPASAFSRCSGPTWIPSAEINSGLATPMKPNTQRK